MTYAERSASKQAHPSLAVIQRPGHRADLCKMVYWLCVRVIVVNVSLFILSYIVFYIWSAI